MQIYLQIGETLIFLAMNLLKQFTEMMERSTKIAETGGKYFFNI
jgi:hypothetical protein